MSLEAPISLTPAVEDTRPLPRWAQLCLTREPAAPMALFRTAVGLCVLGSILSVMWHGAFADLWLPVRDGGYHKPDLPWLFWLIGGADATRIRAVTGVCIAAGALMAVGLGGRFSNVVALVSYQAVTSINPDACGSYDPMLTNALWLCVLAGGTATLSLDCRLRTGAWTSAEKVYAFPRWMALLQIVLVYFCTGIQKVSDTWVPGGEMSAVYYVMQQPTWQRADMHVLAYVFPVTQLFTLLTWLFETCSILVLVGIYFERNGKGRLGRFMRWLPFRRMFAGGGLMLHAGIATMMAVGIFPYIAPAFYLALLAPSAEPVRDA